MQFQAPPQSRLSFWQICLRAIPIIAALVSTSLLAYFVLSGQRSQPFAQLQQQPMAQNGPQQAQQAGQFPQQPQMAQNGGQQGGQFQQQPPQQQMAQNGQQPGQFQQRNAPQEPGSPMQPPPQAQPLDLGPPLPMPNDDTLFLLIQSTLIALNQANMSGNYSVLRDMAAPGFQEANSAVRLAAIFADLRGRNLDLTPILLLQPKLLRRPEMNASGMLRITGFVPTAPERVNFDLIFQPVQSKWRLIGVAVNTSRAPPQPVEVAPTPKSEAPAKPAPAKKAAGSDAASTGEKPAETQVDIRDRLDHPPSPPPPAKPAPKPTIFNPFGH